MRRAQFMAIYSSEPGDRASALNFDNGWGKEIPYGMRKKIAEAVVSLKSVGKEPALLKRSGRVELVGWCV
jgi:hypothetical protein